VQRPGRRPAPWKIDEKLAKETDKISWSVAEWVDEPLRALRHPTWATGKSVASVSDEKALCERAVDGPR